MQLKCGQSFQLCGSFFGSECTVGINSQFYLFRSEVLSDKAEQTQFPVKVDGPDFQLDAPESGTHLLFNARIHFFERAHPDKSVGRYSLFAPIKRRVKELPVPSGPEILHGRFQSEQYRRIWAQEFIRDSSICFGEPACLMQNLFIVGHVVTTQFGKRSTLAPSCLCGIIGT